MFPSQCRGNISKDDKTVVTETCSAAELSQHNRAECREVPRIVCKNQKLLGGGGRVQQAVKFNQWGRARGRHVFFPKRNLLNEKMTLSGMEREKRDGWVSSICSEGYLKPQQQKLAQGACH